MGMFDYVNFECECPKCGALVDGFQTKDGECLLDYVDPGEVENYYSSCDDCGFWVEFNNGILNKNHSFNN